MTIYVLDTNIVSLIVKRDAVIYPRYRAQLTPHNTFIGCPMVWHEARRGLLFRDSRAQMKRFLFLFATFEWQDYNRDDWSSAADWRSQRRKSGKPIADADLLIAVFAYNRNAVLVTNNEKDFVDLSVNIENWIKP